MRKHVVIGRCLFLIATALNSPPSLAQSLLSRPVELVAHTSPGGGPDLVARTLADILTREKLVSQPVTVLNKPGGGGVVAFSYMKTRRGDPHTVLAGIGTTFLAATLRPETGVAMEHVTPLALLAQDPQGIIVAAESPFRNLRALIEAAKRDPESLVASITSPTSTGRMLVWVIEREAGVKFRFVSFKSGSEALTAAMGGHTHFSTENISEAISAVEAKKLRVLAVATAQRMPGLPDTPTLRELGYNIYLGTGRGLALPGGVSKETVDMWEAVVERVYQSPAWKAHAQSSMYENIWMGSAEFSRYMAQRRIGLQEFLLAIGAIKKP